MRRIAVVVLVFAAGLVAALGTGHVRSAEASSLPVYGAGTFKVNVSSHTFVVNNRSTPARAGVAARSTRTIHERIYNPSGPSGAIPTVVFAPGWDNQSAAYDPLLVEIASAGYLVIGVDSPGTSSYFGGTPESSDLANNTLDLSAALDNVEAGSLGGRVDRWAVAAAGHSDGGSAVATLALDSAYVSTQFNAYAVLSGVVPRGQVPGSFGARNNGPVLAMVGTRDPYGNYTPQAGGGGTESVYATAAATRVMVTINGADHTSAYVGGSAQGADTRAAIVNFFNAAEKHAAGARAAFAAEVTSDGLSAATNYAVNWSITPRVVGMAATADRKGYWIALSDGSVRNLGDAAALGGAPRLPAPVVAITATPSGRGYWLAASTGAVYSFGDAAYHGGTGGKHLNRPIVAMAADPATGGYWLLGGDGGVFSFDAPFYGSTGNLRLHAPAVGMTAIPGGGGYYFVASDGGVFSYGAARFHGSMGGRHLNRPVVGMAIDTRTGGYWLDASDGGIFTFDAPFEGSAGSLRLNQPVVSMAAGPGDAGYWLVAADGGIFSYGAPFEGSGVD